MATSRRAWWPRKGGSPLNALAQAKQRHISLGYRHGFVKRAYFRSLFWQGQGSPS